jgi:hypothetical protein
MENAIEQQTIIPAPPAKKRYGKRIAEMTPEEQEKRRTCLRIAQAKYRLNNLELTRERCRLAVAKLYRENAEHRADKILYEKVRKAESNLRKITNVPKV